MQYDHHEKNVLRREYTIKERLLDVKESIDCWFSRQCTQYTIIGVEVTAPKIRWWLPIVIAAHDTMWVSAVMLSDVAANSSPDALWFPHIIAWFTGLI
jgi:hypothetical protein